MDASSPYAWVTRLTPDGDITGVASPSTKHHARKVIGVTAVQWAAQTGIRMADHILNTLTDWPGPRSDEERETLVRATEVSTLDTLTALVSGATGHLAESREPLENVGWYVRNQIPLPEVVRNVHTGQEFLIQVLMDAVVQLLPEHDRVPAISMLTRDVTALWSEFIGRISEEYHRVQDEWMHSIEGHRSRLVNALQRGGHDSVAASRALGYELDQPHVACLLWFDGLDIDAARLIDRTAIARELAAATGSSTNLVIGSTEVRTAVWLGSPTKPVAEVLRSGRWPAQLRAAVGSRLPGVAGFSASRAEAGSAAHVMARSAALAPVQEYAAVELLALLTTDFERARVFVRRALGPIAGTDSRSQELRQTLAAWIDSSGSVAATSQALFMHRNTVSYRLRQLEELLAATDHTRLRCALTIAEAMPQVLTQPA